MIKNLPINPDTPPKCFLLAKVLLCALSYYRRRKQILPFEARFLVLHECPRFFLTSYFRTCIRTRQRIGRRVETDIVLVLSEIARLEFKSSGSLTVSTIDPVRTTRFTLTLFIEASRTFRVTAAAGLIIVSRKKPCANGAALYMIAMALNVAESKQPEIVISGISANMS
jgi:hypothetical protein